MKFQPLRDILTVTVPDGEQTSSSGLVVSTTKKSHTRGIISESGPEAQAKGLKSGVEIIFVGNILREDAIKGNKILWMTSENVIGIIQD